LGKDFLAKPAARNEAFQQALAAFQAGNVENAENLFKAVLRQQPRNVGALNLLGIVLTRVGKFAEAETYLRRAMQEQGGSDVTLHNYALVLKALNRPAEAVQRFTQALALNPSSAETWNGRGKVYCDLQRFAEAKADFARAIQLDPSNAEAYFNEGKSLIALGCLEEAVAAFDRGLFLRPGAADAWFAHGNALRELGRYDNALNSYDRALALEPNFVFALNNRGAALLQLDRYEEALATCDRAIALAPGLALPHSNRASALVYLQRYAEALASCDRAISLDANHVEGWLARGSALTEFRRYQEAFDAYERALAVKPDLAEAWMGRGRIFADLRRYDEAFTAYDRAVTLKADLKYAPGGRLYTKLHLCDWTNLAAEEAQILAGLGERTLPVVPFILMALPSSAADQLQCARRYIGEQPNFAPIWRGEAYSHDRIRVAYLSADFQEHPVAYLTAALFESHDASRFEVTGISFGGDSDAPLRRRIKGAFEHFIDVTQKSDQEIANLIREYEIDIAVDLMGFTEHNRVNVLARRAAPIQVNYLGYAGTMGARYIDYILADRTTIPEDQRVFYEEQVAWLPESFVVSDNRRYFTGNTPTRRECGLPEEAFVYCCFNSAFKITPTMFDIWMRLLKVVEGSVLWLRNSDALVMKNLRREAECRGVAPVRLIFAERTALFADHLARQRQADLFLDTLPYNAHTTTNDALWAGLPVITCLGSTFAGRVAASLVKAAGLDELIATSLEEYEALALKLARDPVLLASIKDKLARNRDVCALFDIDRFRRHIEQAYTTMVDIQRSGKSPRSFRISSLYE
jgi:protein O-GlcNAc transferase